MIVQTVGEVDPAAGGNPAAMRGIATQIRKLGSTMSGQGTAGLPRGGISEAPGGPPGYLERMGSRIKEAIGEDVSAIGSDIRSVSDWAGQFSPFEGENLPPYMTGGGSPQVDSNVQALPVTGKDALESGARDIHASPDFTDLEKPDVKGTDYASYLEEIQALERTPEQIKGDAITNALIELSGLAGAATRAETAEVLRKAGRSAQGVRETGNKELRENVLARMEIETAADQAELNKRKTEAAIGLQEAQAKYYGRESSIAKYLPDMLTAIGKGPGATTEGGLTLGRLNIKYGEPGWEAKFSTAYLKELGFSDDEIAAALKAAASGMPGGAQVITEDEL